MNLLQPSFAKRLFFFLLSDLILFFISLHLAYALRFDFLIDPRFMENFVVVFLALALLKVLFFFLFRVYNITWRFFALDDALNLIKAHLSAAVFFGILFFLFNDLFMPMPRSVIIIDLFLSLMLTGALRISKRALSEQLKQGESRQTLIVGVNPKTSSIIKSAFNGELNYFPVAIFALLKENTSAVNTYINKIKVFAADDLESQIIKQNISAAIITADLSQADLKTLFQRLKDAGIKEIKIAKILGSQHEKLEDLSIEDLLARHPQDLDSEAIADFIKDKHILITGAGGSIGSEITQQCQKFGAASLTLFDNSEFNLYQIAEELPDAAHVLCSVTDYQTLDKLFGQHPIDIVIHAAAYKHVPLCEENVDIAITNNIIGTKNVIDLSIKHQVKKLVIISTDKAVRPTNVMGTTKRIGELYAQNVDSKETEIVAVRFGNVLGSSGSVIPKFKKQIESGGPVTVTHKEMTRYFMLIPEACQLVLQAASIAKGNELFILDMGEPVKICDLAQQMIKLYGKEDEIEVTFTGLRPGEKLYEELLIDDNEKKTEYSSIFIANPTYYPIEQLNNDIQALLTSENKIESLQKIVPEFTHKV
ncbi:MAG: nucleoside-diphosphate sugar epimerase/dehydratase [Helicobacteraceae bacterium]|nr:nucleoside-diphosphate sugar epimerase/dehydratase [Helicobacteraceae bacterium]